METKRLEDQHWRDIPYSRGLHMGDDGGSETKGIGEDETVHGGNSQSQPHELVEGTKTGNGTTGGSDVGVVQKTEAIAEMVFGDQSHYSNWDKKLKLAELLPNLDLSRVELEALVGLSYPVITKAVSVYDGIHGVKHKHHSAGTRMNPNRREEILKGLQLRKNYTEIGVELGITRERVRQIVTKSFKFTGREYQKVRKWEFEEQQQKKIVEEIDKHPFVIAARQKGLTVTDLYKERNTVRVTVNGKKVKIYHMSSHPSITRKGKIKHHWIVRRKSYIATQFDILVAMMTGTDKYFICPASELPIKETSFVENREPNRGGKCHNHLWVTYIDAWDLFEEKQETK